MKINGRTINMRSIVTFFGFLFFVWLFVALSIFLRRVVALCGSLWIFVGSLCSSVF